jgi:hypothetical protein
LIRSAIAFLLGAGVALLARQGFDLYRAYDGVLSDWRIAREADSRRGPAAEAMIRLVERHGNGDPGMIGALKDDLANVQNEPESDIIAEPKKFEIYDRSFLRLGHDLTELNKAVSVSPVIAVDPAATPLQSRLEGTESAASQAHMNYDATAIAYENMVSTRPNHILARALFLPVRLGKFEMFGEAGPKGQDDKDDDD